ncbi:SRPBCC family protein [uncultured Paraglaciecola sp.]|uniref:SRPBCC family protein n=1 Tax=uncultured Paraglaciecola sp. TaxID=1765024 RepID=UPI002616E628|nr:SRPBCC family protein [uncultured Paraglaciecola sp.]
MILIKIEQKVAATSIQVRDTLLDHEQLNRFFNAEFLLVQAEDQGEIQGGKGAIRQVSMLGNRFQERIISANEQHISYQIIGNKPVANHQGDIYLSEDTSSPQPITHIQYHISCTAPWWQPNFLVKHFITKDISQALNKIATLFSGDKT